jgi:hypothetical protein
MILSPRHLVPLLGALSLFLAPLSDGQSVITEWQFDTQTAGTTTSSPTTTIGSGTASTLGMLLYANAGKSASDTSGIYNVAGTDVDNSGTGNNAFRIVGNNGWNSGAAIGTQGAQFNVSTASFTSIAVSFDIEITTQGESAFQVQYTTNGSTWLNGAISYAGSPSSGSVLTNSTNPNIVNGSYFKGATGTDTWFNGITLNLSGVSAVNNDPSFGIRIVNATTGSANTALAGTALNNTSGNWRLDDVTVEGLTAIPEPADYALALGIAALAAVLLRRRQRLAA